MMHLWLVTLDSSRLTGISGRGSYVKDLKMKSSSMLKSVPLVNRIKMSTLTQLVCFISYPFLIKNGNVSLWTSSPCYQRLLGKDCIYVVVDKVTKFAHFFAIVATYTMAQVTDLLFR